MGVFNKTPYTNFHELNLNWVIKKIKEVAADNAFFKKFFKDAEDQHLLGVVTDITPDADDRMVTMDYWDKNDQAFKQETFYNKQYINNVTGQTEQSIGALELATRRTTITAGSIKSNLAPSINITATGTVRYMIITSGSTAARCGVYSIVGNATSTYVVELHAASELTVTVSGGTCTVTNTTTGNVLVYIIPLNEDFKDNYQLSN